MWRALGENYLKIRKTRESSEVGWASPACILPPSRKRDAPADMTPSTLLCCGGHSVLHGCLISMVLMRIFCVGLANCSRQVCGRKKPPLYVLIRACDESSFQLPPHTRRCFRSTGNKRLRAATRRGRRGGAVQLDKRVPAGYRLPHGMPCQGRRGGDCEESCESVPPTFAFPANVTET